MIERATRFGTGPDHGMALVFIAAGVIGLVVTLLALMSGPYRRLTARYLQPGLEEDSDRRDRHQEASAA